MIIKTIIQNLNRALITDITVGAPFGSVMIIHFEKRKEKYSLHINCVWRIEKTGKVITGWNDPNEREVGKLYIESKKLIGKTVSSIEISSLFDLKLFFNDKKILNIFCDRTASEDKSGGINNWVLCDITNNKAYMINNKLKVIETKYE